MTLMYRNLKRTIVLGMMLGRWHLRSYIISDRRGMTKTIINSLWDTFPFLIGGKF
jgi:hypothetical protein